MIPTNVLIPLELYDAIHMTVIKHITSEGMYTKHIQPIQLEYNKDNCITSVVIYAPDLLCQWLRYLMHDKLWCKKISIQHNKHVTSHTCFITPKATNLDCNNETYYVAECINKYLINIGDTTTKLICDDASGNNINTNMLQLPYSITNVRRLQSCGYICAHVDDVTTKLWTNYYNAELERYRYVNTITRKLSHANVNSNILETCNIGDVYVMNEHVDSLGVSDTLELYKAVVNAENKLKEEKRTSNKQMKEKYNNMAIEYYKYTGYKLDVNKEMKNKSLPFRLRELEYMQHKLVRDDNIQFKHDRVTDRVYATDRDVEYLKLKKSLGDLSLH